MAEWAVTITNHYAIESDSVAALYCKILLKFNQMQPLFLLLRKI